MQKDFLNFVTRFEKRKLKRKEGSKKSKTKGAFGWNKNIIRGKKNDKRRSITKNK